MKIFIAKNTLKTFCIAAALLLTSCATVPQPTTTYIPWQARAKNLQTIHNWEVTGSLSIATPNHAVFATYDWKQNIDKYDILLESPLDLVSAELIGAPAFVELEQNGKTTNTAHSPEKLLQETIGWQLPVTPMQDWIRGLPAPNTPAQVTLDAFGRIQGLQQAGWQIDFLHYTAVGNNDLPAMMYLQRPGLRIKIKLNWKSSAGSESIV